MKTRVFEQPDRLVWSDVDAPELEHAREALVRPLAVARCDLDSGVHSEAAHKRWRRVRVVAGLS